MVSKKNHPQGWSRESHNYQSGCWNQFPIKLNQQSWWVLPRIQDHIKVNEVSSEYLCQNKCLTLLVTMATQIILSMYAYFKLVMYGSFFTSDDMQIKALGQCLHQWFSYSDFWSLQLPATCFDLVTMATKPLFWNPCFFPNFFNLNYDTVTVCWCKLRMAPTHMDFLHIQESFNAHVSVPTV